MAGHGLRRVPWPVGLSCTYAICLSCTYASHAHMPGVCWPSQGPQVCVRSSPGPTGVCTIQNVAPACAWTQLSVRARRTPNPKEGRAGAKRRENLPEVCMHAVYLLGRVRASLQFASPARGEMRDGRLHVVASRVHAFGAEAVHSPQPSAGTRRAAAALEQPQQAAGLRSGRPRAPGTR